MKPSGKKCIFLDRDGVINYFIPPRCGELYCDHHPNARSGHDLVPDAVLCLGPVCDSLPSPLSIPPTGSRWNHAAHGPGLRHQLLPAFWSFWGRLNNHGGEWGREPAAVAASLLVSGAPGGICPHSAGHWDGG